MELTREHFHHMAKKTQALSKRLGEYREKLEHATGKVVRSGEVALGAFASGAISGRFAKVGADGKPHEPTLFHMPLNLLLAAGLNLAGYVDAAGEHSEHLNNVGDGFLGGYISGLGFEFGKKWLERGHLFGKSAPASAQLSAPAAAVHGAVSPEQMADMLGRMQAATQHG